jgi:hypothetical protein
VLKGPEQGAEKGRAVNRYGMAIAAAALAGTVMLASSPAWARTQAAAAGSGATWEKAEEVPGSAALNADGLAGVASVSCASAGDCSAGGEYYDSSSHYQAFVVSQADGAWGKAKEVPGTATLNKGGDAQISSVSCASPGECSAGGAYEDTSSHLQAFVDSQG